MIPIALDPAAVKVAVAGRGPLLLRRVRQLRELGAEPLVYCDQPSPDIAEAAAAKLHQRLPTRAEIAAAHVLWVVGLSENTCDAIVTAARASKTLVNVEDVLPQCDFHTPAIVKRGELTLAAATGGASPTAAKLAREALEQAFPERWADALAEAAAARSEARAAGLDNALIAAQTKAIFVRHGLAPAQED